MKLRICCLAAALIIGVPALAESLRVMSFNVRYPSKGDGANVWDLRRDLLVSTIREKNPDIFGTQELFHIQGEYIVEKAPEYAWFGVSRRGNKEDEFMGVFYKKDKLKLLESGNFWLSETPETPGSIAWDMSLPRMVTWGLFQTSEGKKFYFYNTHFAHRRQDGPARLNSARLIAGRVAKLPPNIPFILTGDFNTGAGTEPYEVLAAGLKDAWATSPKKNGPEGTFNGFKGVSTGARIDWIFYRGKLKPLEAETVTYNENGRYPSDHFPVFALFDLN